MGEGSPPGRWDEEMETEETKKRNSEEKQQYVINKKPKMSALNNLKFSEVVKANSNENLKFNSNNINNGNKNNSKINNGMQPAGSTGSTNQQNIQIQQNYQFQTQQQQNDNIFINKNIELMYKRRSDNIYKVNVAWKEDKNLSKMQLSEILKRKEVKHIYDIKKIAKNKMCLYFNNYESANNFLKMGLKDCDLDTFVPAFYLTKIGVIRGIPTNMKMNDLFDEILENENVMKLERLNRIEKQNNDIVRIPTQSIKITFYDCCLPESIRFTYYRERVLPFIGKVRQCFNCWRFGHLAQNCKSQKRCGRCGNNHSEKDCEVADLKCIYCGGKHSANFMDCPENKRQQNIKILMDSKNLNYVEAIDLFPQYTSNSFSLLENLNDFPQLTRQNYAKVLKTTNTRVKYVKDKKKIPQVPKNIDVNRINRYYGDLMNEEYVGGSITENQYKTSEAERLQSLFCNLKESLEKYNNINSESEIKIITEKIEEIRSELNDEINNQLCGLDENSKITEK